MENTKEDASGTDKSKKLTLKKGPVLKKFDVENARLLFQLKEKANKKQFGRKVRDGEIIFAALKLIGSEHIAELQKATYSEQDKLHMAHEDYMKTNGKISLDHFIGKLIRGELMQN